MAAVYVDDLEDYLTPDVVSNTNPQERTRHLAKAESQASDWLTTAGYTLPLTAWPETLEAHVAALANWSLAVSKHLVPEPAASSAMYLEKQAAIRYFEGLASGRITPAGITDSGGVSESTRWGRSRVNSHETRGWRSDRSE